MKIIKDLKKNLDFNSWFDLWHTHFDWDGEGNSSWEKRKQYLDQMLEIFEELKEELKKHKLNNEFQTYCSISLKDSSEDAVYIHTKNPNQNNFPIYYTGHQSSSGIDKKLLDFLEYSNYDWFLDIYEGNEHVILYDRKCGIPPVKQ